MSSALVPRGQPSGMFARHQHNCLGLGLQQGTWGLSINDDDGSPMMEWSVAGWPIIQAWLGVIPY